jgi:hypothetical protein
MSIVVGCCMPWQVTAYAGPQKRMMQAAAAAPTPILAILPLRRWRGSLEGEMRFVNAAESFQVAARRTSACNGREITLQTAVDDSGRAAERGPA